MRVITVAGLKGGCGKTTSAVFLADQLARARRVLLVDTDPQGSALSWSEAASFPFSTVGLPVRDVHRRLPLLAADYHQVVLDTPPAALPIVRSALLAADQVLLPLSPTTIEVDRLRPTLELLAEVEALRPHGVELHVLLTRVRAGTRSSRAARALLAELGLPVLHAEIPLREGYANAFGATLSPAAEYEAVLDELLLAAVR